MVWSDKGLMRIDIVVNDGSPLGVVSSTIWGDSFRIGVGGSEIALLTLCEEWTKRGYEVNLYNNPHQANPLFAQHPVSSFRGEDNRDVLIIFRSPFPAVTGAKGMKVWFSCDQFSRGNYAKFRDLVDKVVCISPFHVNYFLTTYAITDAISIDLPVRIHDFDELAGIEKIPNKFIFTSVPERGLKQLLDMWKGIQGILPDAALTITSDYRLWGTKHPSNDKFRAMSLGKSGIAFLGAIPRKQMLEELASADWYVYPCIYDELFCISCAEALVAGAYAITSNVGALATTSMGRQIPGNPPPTSQYLEAIGDMASDSNKRREIAKKIQELAIKRFHPDHILDQWDEKVFGI
jgi:glycosyltransferase involved in cell wall biosynthesis